MDFKFPSLAYPAKYGYRFDNTAWSSSSETSGYFRQFETYGDRLIQHSGDWSATFDFLTDYCASLADAMMTNPDLVQAVSGTFYAGLDSAEIPFAASVVWRESDGDWSKRRYVSMRLRKVGNKTKEHDKRYVEINRYMDGSCASILRLICGDYTTGLSRYLKREAVRLWAGEQKVHPGYGEGWNEYFDGDWHKNNALRGAVNACRSQIDAAQSLLSAQDSLNNYKERLKQAEAVAVDALSVAVGE
jgi:hypothetical protein